MSTQAVSTGQGFSASAFARGFAIRLALSFAVIAVLFVIFKMTGLGSVGAHRAAALGPLPAAHLHAPNWSLLAMSSLAIKIHFATVLAAFGLATLQMVGPKGRTFHRVLGWTLVVLLVTTAVAALFIRNPSGGLFNPFQIFSLWTLVGIPLAVFAARRHDVRRHARIMTGFYLGSLLIAGLLTFIPGRLMWWMFFG